MELLCDYVNAAIQRGLVDEWHVWDFTRKPSDKAWLRETFPIIRLTPGEGFRYFSTTETLNLVEVDIVYKFRVSCMADVHVGLRRLSGEGPSFEIVLGGWGNTRSAIRVFQRSDRFERLEEEGLHSHPDCNNDTLDILPQCGFVDIELRLGRSGLSAHVGGVKAVEYGESIPSGTFEVLYRSGLGYDAEWRFPQMPLKGAYLFLSATPKPVGDTPSPRYMPFYQHYARNLADYSRDLFLKCDDDIVFIDLDKLGEFIQFSLSNRQYFLISANIVNNGVCAYFQQQKGKIPRFVVDLEMPRNGVCGSLWESSEKATALHRFALGKEMELGWDSPQVTEWNQRISINFVSFIGEDFRLLPDWCSDDEQYICYPARWRSGRSNAIYWPFIVSHLSFWPQDRGLELGPMLESYGELARKHGVKRKC